MAVLGQLDPQAPQVRLDQHQQSPDLLAPQALPALPDPLQPCPDLRVRQAPQVQQALFLVQLGLRGLRVQPEQILRFRVRQAQLDQLARLDQRALYRVRPDQQDQLEARGLLVPRVQLVRLGLRDQLAHKPQPMFKFSALQATARGPCRAGLK